MEAIEAADRRGRDRSTSSILAGIVDLGVALPNNIPGVRRDDILGWARGAEEAGFSFVAVLDRLVYDSYEPLIALSAAAAVTSQIGLLTNIIVLPWRVNAALIAKQLATIDSLSNGRLTVGLGVGGRDDDFRLGGAIRAKRGRDFDAMLGDMLAVWRGSDEERASIGPRLDRVPPLLIGGTSAATFRRVAAFGDGWTIGVGTLQQFRAGCEQLDAAWLAQGRAGRPRRVALAYYAFGAEAGSMADTYLRDYYAFLGPLANVIAGLTVTSPEDANRTVAAYEQAGADQFLFLPASSEIDQLRQLAAAVL
jgi:alkanesulfonate monooxygenase SsuD/methylene tetrahydromethanopterin reductase-like flavin-dependent oxidoreductase (luciferase family)